MVDIPVRWRDRAQYTAERLLAHVLDWTIDDGARRARQLAHLETRGPGRRLPLPEAQDPCPREFFDRYVRTNTAVVLRGLARDWPAVRRWSPTWLRQRFGDVVVHVMNNDYGGAELGLEAMRLGDYIARIIAGDRSKYLRFSNLARLAPALDDDLLHHELDRYRPPGALGRGHNLFFAPAGGLTPLHAAVQENLFVQIHGTRRWILMPASYDPVLRPLNVRSNAFYSRFDPEAPDHAEFPEMRHLDTYEVVLEPGDVLYNPPSWWHQVSTSEVSIGMGNRWFSGAALRANPTQLMLTLLATNPSLLVLIREQGDYVRVLQEAERRLKRTREGAQMR